MLHVRIRDARIAAGLTQADLAALADVPRSVLQDLETPGHDMRVSTLRKVAAHLPKLRGLLLALDGAEMLALSDADAAREALTSIIASAQQALAGLAGETTAPGGGGAVRVNAGTSLDAKTRRKIAELDAAVDRGEIPIDDES